MLEGKTRIPPVDVDTLPDDLRETLDEQRKLRGAPLYPYLFYARNPAYFRAAKAMWAALQQETKRVPVTLRSLLNRRVASGTGRADRLRVRTGRDGGRGQHERPLDGEARGAPRRLRDEPDLHRRGESGARV